ncbi:unnamed protein product [Paramecium sonneborni]|uniref:Uncharacterized protein n=1 Tax=Paramecium sonneborni TaxID=65129 RepID=A0A8S1PB06_9CILI|nr:unnamed protein product [Paramecium sonneborni]
MIQNKLNKVLQISKSNILKRKVNQFRGNKTDEVCLEIFNYYINQIVQHFIIGNNQGIQDEINFQRNKQCVNENRRRKEGGITFLYLDILFIKKQRILDQNNKLGLQKLKKLSFNNNYLGSKKNWRS